MHFNGQANKVVMGEITQERSDALFNLLVDGSLGRSISDGKKIFCLRLRLIFGGTCCIGPNRKFLGVLLGYICFKRETMFSRCDVF